MPPEVNPEHIQKVVKALNETNAIRNNADASKQLAEAVGHAESLVKRTGGTQEQLRKNVQDALQRAAKLLVDNGATTGGVSSLFMANGIQLHFEGAPPEARFDQFVTSEATPEARNVENDVKTFLNDPSIQSLNPAVRNQVTTFLSSSLIPSTIRLAAIDTIRQIQSDPALGSDAIGRSLMPLATRLMFMPDRGAAISRLTPNQILTPSTITDPVLQKTVSGFTPEQRTILALFVANVQRSATTLPPERPRSGPEEEKRLKDMAAQVQKAPNDSERNMIIGRLMMTHGVNITLVGGVATVTNPETPNQRVWNQLLGFITMFSAGLERLQKAFKQARNPSGTTNAPGTTPETAAMNAAREQGRKTLAQTDIAIPEVVGQPNTFALAGDFGAPYTTPATITFRFQEATGWQWNGTQAGSAEFVSVGLHRLPSIAIPAGADAATQKSIAAQNALRTRCNNAAEQLTKFNTAAEPAIKVTAEALEKVTGGPRTALNDLQNAINVYGRNQKELGLPALSSVNVISDVNLQSRIEAKRKEIDPLLAVGTLTDAQRKTLSDAIPQLTSLRREVLIATRKEAGKALVSNSSYYRNSNGRPGLYRENVSGSFPSWTIDISGMHTAGEIYIRYNETANVWQIKYKNGPDYQDVSAFMTDASVFTDTNGRSQTDSIVGKLKTLQRDTALPT